MENAVVNIVCELWMVSLLKVDKIYNIFNSEEVKLPIVVKNDEDYYTRLKNVYKQIEKKANDFKLNTDCLTIIKKYKEKILESILLFYKGNVISAHAKINNLVANCLSNSLAATMIQDCDVFPGRVGTEIQFYRARVASDAIAFKTKDMLHLPFKMRDKTKSYRYSIPGVPCLYLCNSSYGCWLELSRPPEHSFNVSPVVVKEDVKIFNFAINTYSVDEMEKWDDGRIKCWIKIMMLLIASSFIIDDTSRSFKSEYLIPQSVMLACCKKGIDGVVYYSNRVSNGKLSKAALNLALFAPYKYRKEYGDICHKIMMDEPVNFSLYKQLSFAERNVNYALRTGFGIMELTGNKTVGYGLSEFYHFDQFLFGNWKDKETASWGNALI